MQPCTYPGRGQRASAVKRMAPTCCCPPGTISCPPSLPCNTLLDPAWGQGHRPQGLRPLPAAAGAGAAGGASHALRHQRHCNQRGGRRRHLLLPGAGPRHAPSAGHWQGVLVQWCYMGVGCWLKQAWAPEKQQRCIPRPDRPTHPHPHTTSPYTCLHTTGGGEPSEPGGASALQVSLGPHLPFFPASLSL